VIADARFGVPQSGVRRLRFVPRASIPVDAACVVANGIRETLRELLGEGCELDLASRPRSKHRHGPGSRATRSCSWSAGDGRTSS